MARMAARCSGMLVLADQDRLAALDEIGDANGLIRRRDFREHAVDEIDDGLIARGERERAVTLPRCLDRLPDRDRCGRHDGQQNDRRGAHRQLVAHHEFSRAIRQRVGARAHRFVVQMAPQVLGESFDRGIALRRGLLQRLEHDVVEVAPQRAHLLRRIRAASLGRAGSVSTIARMRSSGVCPAPTVGCRPVRRT